VTKENKIKNLTLTEIKKQAKKLDAQTEHEILVGEDVYKVKIDNVFRRTKQNQLLDDLVAFFSEGNERVELLDLATPYTTLLLIKHFTSIEVSDNIDEALEMLDILIDLELLGAILNLMPEQEVLDMYELLNATVNRMKENMVELEDETKRLSEVVENDEVKEMLLNGTRDKEPK